MEIIIRKLIYLARNNADEHAKRRLMPVVRDLIQKVVIGKTPGHQPATLQVHGSIANIMASMEVFDLMEQQYLAAARNDFMSTGVRRTGHGSPNAKRSSALCGGALSGDGLLDVFVW